MTRTAPPRALPVRFAAHVARSAGWRELAARLYRRALRHAPTDAEASLCLGETLATLERWDEAALAFRQAARLRPDCADTRGSLAWALARAGRDDAVTDALRQLVELQPGRAEPHALLGAWLRRRGRPAEALRAFRDALAAPSAPATTRFVLGEALLGIEPWRTLAAELEQARALAQRAAGAPSLLPPPDASAPSRVAAALRARLAGVGRGCQAGLALLGLTLRRAGRDLLLALGGRLARAQRARLALRCFRMAERLRPPRSIQPRASTTRRARPSAARAQAAGAGR